MACIYFASVSLKLLCSLLFNDSATGWKGWRGSQFVTWCGGVEDICVELVSVDQSQFPG